MVFDTSLYNKYKKMEYVDYSCKEEIFIKRDYV